MSTTWDPTRWNSQMVLSNGNLTATSNAGASICGLGVAAITGKTFMQLVLTSNQGATDGQISFGIGNASTDRNNYLGANANSMGYWPGDSAIYTNGNSASSAPFTVTDGDIIGIAIDPTAKLFWGTKDGTTWNAGGTANPATGGTANPATGVGGVSFSGITGTIYPALAMTKLNTITNVRFDAASWSYGPPSGFSEINVSAAFPRNRSGGFIG